MSKTGFFFSLLCVLATLFLPPVYLYADTPRAPEISADNSGQPLSAPIPQVGPVDIIDIYGPISLPEPPPYLLYGIFALLIPVVLAALFFLYRWWRKKSVTTAVDPADQALTALSEAELKIPESGNAVFVTEISHILRSYIEQKYNIRTTRQTTREFFLDLHKSVTNVSTPIRNHAKLLKPCLVLCDIVKFAHFPPADNDTKTLSNNVRSFVEATRLRPETEV